jgi:hypothetical protein
MPQNGKEAMARGQARTEEEILQAVMRGNGDKSVIAKGLNTSLGQVNNYLYRYPHINDVFKASRRDLKGPEIEEDTPVEAVQGETEVLTESQKRVIDDIEANGRGDWANVDKVPSVMLFKLEEWGLIDLKRGDNLWFAKLTDEGYSALITGDFSPKENDKVAPKPAAKKPANEPKKKGGWRNIPKTEAPDTEQPINPVIGQDFTAKWHEQEIQGSSLPVNMQGVATHDTNSDCGNCSECLHREALALIMEKVPAVKEIYEHLAAKKKAEKQIEAALKKFGG